MTPRTKMKMTTAKDDGKHNIGDDKETGKQPGDINPRDYGEQ
jgi:hypothetical protein